MEKKLKKLSEKIEDIFDGTLQSFKKSPVKSSIKCLILAWVFKKIWDLIKNND